MGDTKNKVDLALKGLIAVLAAVMIVVVAGTLEQRVVDKGDRAPEFSVKSDQGPSVSRSEFGGKLLVLNFWASWCPPCVEEWPSLNEFARRYKEKGVTVLAVSVDTNEKRYRDFLSRGKPNFLTFRDPEGNISSSYGTFIYPETYIIDTQGKVLYKIAQGQNWNDPAFLNYFNSLL